MPDANATYATLDDWIAREAISFSVDSPADAFDAAVDRMVASLGERVEVLGFGEALHGGEEILMLRNRLFRRLAEAHGYTAIAVESSFPRGFVTNDYVNSRGGATTYDEVRDTGLSHGFGNLEANRELVEWMRTYNADDSHAAKLQFFGFDQPAVTAGPASPRLALRVAIEALAELDPTTAAAIGERVEPLLGAEDADWENPIAWRDPAKSPALLAATASLRIETEELISALVTRRPEWANDEARFAEALQHAKIARRLLTFFVAMATNANYAASLGVRDASMADNVKYIASRANGKVLVFAHNMHLQRGRALWMLGPTRIEWWPAGSHLSATLGPRYAVIGTGVGTSVENGIAEPEPGSLEARLTAAPGPVRFAPTHGGLGHRTTDLPVRSGSKKNPTYFPLTAQSFTDFDAWVVLDSVTYNRGGRPLP